MTLQMLVYIFEVVLIRNFSDVFLVYNYQFWIKHGSVFSFIFSFSIILLENLESLLNEPLIRLDNLVNKRKDIKLNNNCITNRKRAK